MTDDLRIELRARNNVLYHAIFDTHPSVAAFCRAHDLDQGLVGELLNLTKSPYLRDGQPGRLAVQLSAITKILPEDLFPVHLYQLTATRAALEMPAVRLLSLRHAKALQAADDVEAGLRHDEAAHGLAAALGTLRPRDKQALTLLFGLDDGEERTLKEVGEALNVGPARARQITERALRRMRHPSRSKALKPLMAQLETP